MSLGPSRIVTLVGPGGVGKTRLAIELSQQAASEYRDGAAWCDLAAIGDPTALPAAMASALSISMTSHDSVTAAIVDGLRGRESLLLVDNCEHLIDAAGALLSAIAEGCAGVAIIATSRRPLGIDGEQVWPLEPLDPTGAGVDLFVERALGAGVRPWVTRDRDSVVALCRRLDGLPLAIELAAPRMRTMTPAEMLEHLCENSLGENIGLVSRKSRQGPSRHRALVDTLDWSYNLLDAQEQALLARLAVFAGGFDQRAVEAVCGSVSSSNSAVLEALAGLVDHSMISFDRTDRVTRYRLLDTIRAYARTKLTAQDEPEVRQRHLEYYCALVADSVPRWRIDHRSEVGVFDDEWDNIRVAVQHAFSMADAEALDRLLEGLAWPSLWSVRPEIGTWASAASGLAGCSGITVGLAAHTAALRGQTDRAAQLAGMALAAAEHEEDPSTHHAWAALFLAHTARRDDAAARAAAAAAHVSMRAAYGDFGDAFWSAIIAFLDAKTDPTGAAENAQRAERLIGSAHNPALSGEVLSMLARYYGRAGEPSRGITCCREALALADRYRLAYCRNSASAALAYLASAQGAAGAPEDIAEALARAYQDRLWFWVWQSVGTASRWFAEAGDLHTAAVLVGHIEAHGHRSISPSVRDSIAVMPGAAAAMSEGARLHREAIVALALERLPVTARS